MGAFFDLLSDLVGLFVLLAQAPILGLFMWVVFPAPDPPALFMLALPVFLLPLAPLMSLISRRDEYQADRYAAEHAGAGPLIDALVKLYRDNASTLTPDPWYSGFHDSHPPAALRIAHLERLSRMPDPTGQPAHA